MKEHSVKLLNSWIVPLLVALQFSLAPAGQQADKQSVDDLYGLYYGDWDKQGSDLAIVISPDGQPIPPKENDPQAPTRPGFYVGEQHFEFASSNFSPQGFSFRTRSVNGRVFSFRGRFGREQVDVIPEVPYLAGVLAETQNRHIVRKKKIHFGHAVVL